MNSEQKAIAKLGALLTGILLLSWAGSFGFEWLADHVWSGFTWFSYAWSFGFIVLVGWISWELIKPEADRWPVFVIPVATGFLIFVGFVAVAANVNVGITVGIVAMMATFLNTVFVVGYLEREWKS